MPELDADFEITTNNLETEYEISEGQHFDCSFEIFATGTTWGDISGNINNQTDLKEALDDKANVSAVEIIAEDVNTITNTLDSYGDIVTYDAADFATKNQGELADTALQPGDNITELNNNANFVNETQLTNGLAEKQDTISDLSTIRSNAENGQSAYSTIQNYGDIVTYNASDFATSAQGTLADSALQPNDNISELNNDIGYITGIDSEDVTDALGYTPYNSTNPDGYQENVIESIEVNGTAQTISNKTVDITVPTDTSDLTNGAGYITSATNLVTQDVIDEAYGTVYTVKFMRPITQAIDVEITVKRQGYSGADLSNAVKDAIMQWYNGEIDGVDGVKIGKAVSPFEISAAVSDVLPDIFVTLVKVGEHGSTTSATTMSFGAVHKATLDRNNITVTVTQ